MCIRDRYQRRVHGEKMIDDSSLIESMRQLFRKQQILPFSYIKELLKVQDSASFFSSLSSCSVHLTSGLFAIKSERLYASESNVWDLRKARNAVLDTLRRLPIHESISKEALFQQGIASREILNRILPEIADQKDGQYRLKFIDESIDDFNSHLPFDSLVSDSRSSIAAHKAPEIRSEPMEDTKLSNVIDEAELAMAKEVVIEELRRDGVSNSSILLGTLKNDRRIKNKDNLDAVLKKVVQENCVVIEESILLSESNDSTLQPLRDATISLLRQQRIWKKIEIKEQLSKLLGSEVSEGQVSRLLKEFCKLKAKKWVLKFSDQ
eukprot:TRINITY_DN9709_c0_g1_i5.p1 TRINITY_DN9709_c0_g1~~TRINITY_DN9709_c0_g1_i5.p1  ORF type:complete len:322 (+),score=58.98 TRINITY_DN9709_c0_g1_i5:150-1115(+)